MSDVREPAAGAVGPVAGPASPTASPAAAADPAVAAALEPLAGLAGLPVEEHVGRYEEAHRRLALVLRGLDDEAGGGAR